MSDLHKPEHDALTEYFFTAFLPFVIKYKMLLISAVALVILLLSGLGFYSMLNERKEKNLLNSIYTELSRKKEISASTLSDLNKEYGGHDASLEIKWRLAAVHVKNEKFSKAADAYRQIIDEFPENPLAAHAILALASCLEYEEKYDEALKLFDQGLKEYKDSNIKAYFLYKKACTYYYMKKYPTAKKTALKALTALQNASGDEEPFEYSLENRIRHIMNMSTVNLN